MHNLANVRCNGPQQIPKFQARCDTTGQIQKQLQPLILLLHTSEIQTVIQREGDDTADQPKETYLFSAKRIHCVANEAENTQLAMRGCQWYAYHRAHAHFFFAHGLKRGYRSSVSQLTVCCGSLLRTASHKGSNSSMGRSGKGSGPF